MTTFAADVDVPDLPAATGTGSGRLVGVLGASGGVGASSLAADIAVQASAVLVDLDVAGGGVDVLLGLDAVPGARWSGVHLAGGHLDPQALRDGLPALHGAAVLAADVAELDPDAVGQVLTAACRGGTVVVDLPRAPCAERAVALLRCSLLVVVARSDVPGLVSAHALLATLPDLPTGIVLRRAGRGDAGPARAAQLLGVPLFGALPPMRAAWRSFDARRPSRSSRRIAAGVLAGLGRTAA